MSKLWYHLTVLVHIIIDCCGIGDLFVQPLQTPDQVLAEIIGLDRVLGIEDSMIKVSRVAAMQASSLL